MYSLTDFLDNQRNPSQSMKYFVCISRILSEIEKSSAYLSSLLALMVSLCSFIKLFFSSFNVSKQFLGSSWVYIHISQVTSSHHSLLTPAPALPTIQLFIPTVSPHSDLQRPCCKFHTIALHTSVCTSTGSQYVAIIGPVVGAESKAINPFLLLFAPWLAVTGWSIIGQEHTCPLHFTLISLQLQTLIPDR